MDAVLFIHGRSGNALEADRYRALFPDHAVFGLDYHGRTPRDAGREIHAAVRTLKLRYERVVLVAVSIGAFFSLHGELDRLIEKAFFISPVTDMEGLICAMMAAEGVSETELQSRGEIPTSFGEPLSWEYLSYVRTHPVSWTVPTAILCGSADTLVPVEATETFANATGASLTVMDGGEHWFHTEAQLAFLDRWIERETGLHGSGTQEEK